MTRDEAFLRVIEPGLALSNLLCTTAQAATRPENPLEAPVLSLLQKDVPADTIRAALDTQRQAGLRRALTLRALLQVATSAGLVTARHDMLRFVARSLRAGGRHYMSGLDGCGPAVSAVLRTLYGRIVDWAASVVGTASTDSGMRAMALSAVLPVLPTADVPLLLRPSWWSLCVHPRAVLWRLQPGRASRLVPSIPCLSAADCPHCVLDAHHWVHT